jgi:hypothetical protein
VKQPVTVGLSAAIACASLALAVLGTPSSGSAQVTTTIASGAPSEASASASPTASPTASSTPQAHRLKPIIFATPAPTPVRTRHPYRPKATPRPKPRPTRAPTPTPLPVATPTPTPTPTEAPTATPAPRRARHAATPTPSPTPSEEPSSNVPTPIPTQPPTPRPLAPNQPTIPDSMQDPNVRSIMARPIRELSEIGWMQGTWSVTGVTNKQDGTTQPIPPTTYVFSPIMKNRWMFGADGRSADYLYITYDPFARHWVVLRFGNNPSYGMWTSERGWVGNRIDFITNFSFVNGREYRRRLTIIHKDPRTFGIYELEQQPDGSFIPDDAYDFKRI